MFLSFNCLNLFDVYVSICYRSINIFCSNELQDKELRQRLQDSERKLGLSMPLDQAKERATQLESEVTSLERSFLDPFKCP